MSLVDWDKIQNFTESEMACSHCGKCDMHPEFMSVLQVMRDEFAKPIIISSGYRCTEHPVERPKSKPGEHTYGLASDILCYGEDALELLEIALDNGIKRVGVNQKGRFNHRYIHIGLGDTYQFRYPRGIWTY